MKSKNNIKLNNKKKSKKNININLKKGGFFFSNYRINNNTFDNSSISKLYNDYKSLLIELILNSQFKLLSDTSLYGLIFLGEIQNPQYYFKDSKGNEIKKYIIKGSFISNNTKEIEVFYDNGGKTFASVTLKDFENEIKTQKDIYIKSLETYYETIVPDIQIIPTSIKLNKNETYDRKIHEIPIGYFIHNIVTENEKEREKINKYFEKVDNINIKFHIFIMQYIENYYPLVHVMNQLQIKIKNNRKEIDELSSLTDITHKNILIKEKINDNWINIELIQKVKYIYVTYHILLGLLGYIHGDAHAGNIMIYYDKDKPEESIKQLKAYVIDFGFIKYNEKLDYNLIINYNHNYHEVLNKIYRVIESISDFCDIPRKSHGSSKEEWGCYTIYNYELYNNFNSFSKILNILTTKIDKFINSKNEIERNKELNILYNKDIQKYKILSNYNPLIPTYEKKRTIFNKLRMF